MFFRHETQTIGEYIFFSRPVKTLTAFVRFFHFVTEYFYYGKGVVPAVFLRAERGGMFPGGFPNVVRAGNSPLCGEQKGDALNTLKRFLYEITGRLDWKSIHKVTR